ncbi:ABC transporter substrate-binding protein [Neobacillus terrae]|uniref:ABC transporter substrate-binding protein n=1 Tax=Neobacillus terrae TaxID=3034837 RepID=UPI00140977B1|nr:ABC transporter substrate-binding protein [Neobacillus terrae]NHM31296.1 ABC transporter substrate-binding protein [Neobacillus terrae]
MKKLKQMFLCLLLPSALILSSCGQTTSKSENSGGGKKGNEEVVVGTWGGDYQQFLKENVDTPLAGNHPDTKVVYAIGDQTTRMTKMRTEKSGEGTFDVIHLADYDMQQMINEGLLSELDYSKMPNAEHAIPDLKHPNFIPHIYSASVLIYNKNKVKDVPDSWGALWDPKYKGKVGILSQLWTNWVYAAAALEGKNNTTNWDDAWDTLVKLRDVKPKIYATQEELGQAIQTGEVWMTISFRARAVQWNNAGGEPLGNVVPKEGTYPIVFGAAIPKNAKNVNGAYNYLNAMLDPKGQVGFSQKMGYAPTVDNAPLPKDLQSSIGFTKEEMDLIKPLDLKYVAKNNPRWKEQFEKDIASK